MEAALELSCLINDKLISCQSDERGKWRKHSVLENAIQADFVNAHICRDISVTISNCLFVRDYNSHIKYSLPTILLIFGLEGVSHFRFSDTNISGTVKAGDVWMFGVNKHTLIRTTPANSRCKMAVFKYSAKRIHDAFNHTDALSCQLEGDYMIRLGIQQKPDIWTDNVIANQLSSVSDRLLAEARALELIAQWLNPINNARQLTSKSLKPVVDLLLHNLVNPPGLNQLAKLAGMSHTRLTREFKKHYGMTVFDWLRLQRLSLAKSYLDDSTLSVTDIAQSCGFSSGSHFSQLFKMQFGMTPRAYRSKQAPG